MKRTILILLAALAWVSVCLASSGPAPATPPSTTLPPTTTATTLKPALNPVSLPYLMRHKFDGRDLRREKVLADNKDYARYYITYRSGKLKISGIMNVPKGNGPFPVMILNHGYINPKYYTNGRGLKREQDYLTKKGYIVIHPDYRNHAGSDKDPDYNLKLHTGYVEDVINAAYAVKSSHLKIFDKENIGMLGHSLGGGVALSALVVRPELFKACVLFAPTSTDYRDNFERWILRRREAKYGPPETAREIIKRYGLPKDNPEFWDNISAKTFLDRIKTPIQVHHGTADKSVPLEWSQRLAAALKQHGKKVEFFTYTNGKHEFIAHWPLVMRRTAAFVDSYLK